MDDFSDGAPLDEERGLCFVLEFVDALCLVLDVLTICEVAVVRFLLVTVMCVIIVIEAFTLLSSVSATDAAFMFTEAVLVLERNPWQLHAAEITTLLEHPIADIAALMVLRPSYHHGQNMGTSAMGMAAKAIAHF